MRRRWWLRRVYRRRPASSYNGQYALLPIFVWFADERHGLRTVAGVRVCLIGWHHDIYWHWAV
jgi:hypothetical protein